VEEIEKKNRKNFRGRLKKHAPVSGYNITQIPLSRTERFYNKIEEKTTDDGITGY